MKAPPCRTLRLILGDQLNAAHRWFEDSDEDVLYLIAELHQEATYTRHHIQKISAFFAAMEAFAAHLEALGHRVLHLDLDATADFADLPALLQEMIACSGTKRFEYQRPDEYRLTSQLERFCAGLDIPSRCLGSEHFLLPFGELPQWFDCDKRSLMEHFYRRMRRRLGILLDDDGRPEGGRWNFDAENRGRLPAGQTLPDAHKFANPAGPILERIRRHEIPVMGHLDGENLSWPVDRDQSLQLLDFFLGECLPNFGRFQDAMSTRDWSLFHSRLSFSLNTKMLSPAEVVAAAVDAWSADKKGISLAAVEGFARQIIGWREYMRGIYWTHMPEYASKNHFGHERPLPRYYWDGKTRMACMAHAIGQSLDHAYAHHIQRLMVTGNFALLAGIDPAPLDEWYLGVYIDAVQWVELPNTRGMSQFADGGIVASKPYCASGNYIRRMSDYCKGCHYDVKLKSGEGSCPFNSLYWHFMARNRETLSRNPRIGMLFGNWDRMDKGQREQVLETAEGYLAEIDEL